MQGTGTYVDPYQIETWDDFFNMENDSLSTYFLLVRDLDANLLGGWTPNMKVHTNLRSAPTGQIDEYGRALHYKIRNIEYHAGTTGGASLMVFNMYGGTWEDVEIENVLSNCVLFDYIQSGRTVYMKNCKISAECYCLFNGIQGDCERCTFNLNLIVNLKGAYTGGSPTFRYSSVKARIQNPDWMSTTFQAYYSRIEIKYANPVSESYANLGISATNSVLAIEFPESQTYAVKIQGNVNEPSVVDETLWGNCPKTNATSCIFLPTASMKNADRLNEAGFSVIAVN